MVAWKEGDNQLCGISFAIWVVLDFPKPGIMFQDITMLLNINFLISKIERNFGVVFECFKLLWPYLVFYDPLSNALKFFIFYFWYCLVNFWIFLVLLGIFEFFWYCWVIFWIFLVFLGDFWIFFGIFTHTLLSTIKALTWDKNLSQTLHNEKPIELQPFHIDLSRRIFWSCNYLQGPC